MKSSHLRRICGLLLERVMESRIAVAAVLVATPIAHAQTTKDFTFTQYGTYYSIPGGPARVWLPDAGTPLRGLMVFDNFARNNTSVEPFGKDTTAIEAYRNAARTMGFGRPTTPKTFDGLSAAKTQQSMPADISGRVDAAQGGVLKTTRLSAIGRTQDTRVFGVFGWRTEGG